jgi:hypothetical protein
MSINFMKPTFLTVGFVFVCFVLHSADSLFTFNADTPSASTDLFVDPSYSIQLPKPCPDANFSQQTIVPNESTDYSMRILRPCPGTNYCLQITEPSEGINYTIQTIQK